jgi:oxygen-independent coproporphyrinogen-3 oxidase
MEPDELAQILEAIPGAPWREFTMEAAPGTLREELLQAWAGFGVNRVSLGVQSFVDRELRQTGRRHNAEVVEADCHLLRAAGISNFNIDLIAGLPHQTPETWEESLGWITRLQPPHVSVYMLEVDEDSRLGLEILGQGSRYGASAVASDEGIVANYERATRFLTDAGIPRYEISNFARPGWESRHNLKYWRMEPYLGFGVDAHSCDGEQRWGTPDELEPYLRAVEDGHNPARDLEPVRPIEEHFLTGLRLDAGLALDPATLPPVLEQRIAAMVSGALVEWNDSRLRLTARGLLVSNEVFEQFLGIDAELLEETRLTK